MVTATLRDMRLAILRAIIACGVAGFLCLWSASARSEQAFHDIRLGNRPAFDLSPDGQHVAYVLSGSRSTQVQIWVEDVRGDHRRRLVGTLSNEGNASLAPRPRWSPDGSALAFIGDVDGVPRLQIWSRAQPEQNRIFRARRACANSCPGYDIQWAPNSGSVYYLADEEIASHQPQVPDALRERRALLFEDPAHNGVTVRRSPNSAPNSRTHESTMDVMHATVSNGRLATLIGGLRVNNILLSPNGASLLAIVKDGEELEAKQAYQSYYLIALQEAVSASSRSRNSNGGELRAGTGTSVRRVASRVRQFYVGIASWSPNSRSIAFAEQGALSEGDVFLIDASTANITNLTSDIPRHVAPGQSELGSSRNFAYSGKFGNVFLPPVWSPDGRQLFVRRSRGPSGELWRIDIPTQRSLRISEEGVDVRYIVHRSGVASGIVIARRDDGDLELTRVDGDRLEELGHFRNAQVLSAPWSLTSSNQQQLSFVEESETSPPEIVSFDPRSRRLTTLTSINAGWTQRGGEVRPVEWSTADGIRSTARLYLPVASNDAAAGPPPVIVEIYPGITRGSDDRRFRGRPDLVMSPLSLLRDRGFAILVPDLPIRQERDSCGRMGQDIMRSVEAAAAAAPLDSGRVSIIGHSFGGWGVNCAISGANFASAVSVAGLSDMVSYSFTPYSGGEVWSIGGGQVQIGRSFADAPERFLSESPIAHIASMRTPLLILHGKADGNVDADQSVEMFSGLSRAQRVACLVTYDGVGHGNIVDQPDYVRRVTAWIEYYSRRPSSPERSSQVEALCR